MEQAVSDRAHQAGLRLHHAQYLMMQEHQRDSETAAASAAQGASHHRILQNGLARAPEMGNGVAWQDRASLRHMPRPTGAH